MIAYGCYAPHELCHEYARTQARSTRRNRNAKLTPRRTLHRTFSIYPNPIQPGCYIPTHRFSQPLFYFHPRVVRDSLSHRIESSNQNNVLYAYIFLYVSVPPIYIYISCSRVLKIARREKERTNGSINEPYITHRGQGS